MQNVNRYTSNYAQKKAFPSANIQAERLYRQEKQKTARRLLLQRSKAATGEF